MKMTAFKLFRIMGKSQKEWGRKGLDKLKLQLGGCCVLCGQDEQVEFDCIKPACRSHHGSGSKRDTASRYTFYKRQLELNNLQLLCSHCHGYKTRKENNQQFLQLYTEPF